MKLATYKDGSRDGQLVVVSHDLSTAHYASGIATRLQQVLDDWNFMSPQLQDLYVALNQGRARHPFAFDPARCMAPLPRACQRVSAPAWLPHVQRLHQARGAEPPGSWLTEPLMFQAGSDTLLGPCDEIVAASEDFGIDFDAGIAAITGDVPVGTGAQEALEHVRLLMLTNDVTLRHLAGPEQARGCGPLHSKPGAAFSPVAVTPDELGDAWQGGRVHLTLQCIWNGRKVGLCDAGASMHFHFGQLIAYLARTRSVGAGAIVGAGPVSHEDSARGYSCIVEKRALDTLEHGEPRTPYLHFGDTVRIEMKRHDGASIFGAIEQTVAAATA